MALPNMETLKVQLQVVDADITGVQSSIDALGASPPTDSLVPIIQSLKDITNSLSSTTQDFINLVKSVRINQ